MPVLLPLSLMAPLLLALLLAGRGRRAVPILAPWVSLPPLALAALPGLEMELPWLLLGMRLGVDGVGAPFLLLAGLLWTGAGICAQGYLADDAERPRFYAFWLLTYTGNLGVFLALDGVGFYLFFALMSFAAYGLIVHDGSAPARRAGRVYLILAVIGEVLLLVVLFRLGASFGNPDLRSLAALLAPLPDRDWIIALALLSFAIKMGAVPLHVWLAVAHPWAPTPASAVLSGVIIKAGLMGWLRFLPLGEAALPDWGSLCLAAGMLSAFYAVAAGLPQRRVKTVLAYSSVSQMGLITALLGMGLTAPELWPPILGTILIFSLHHGLAKGTLFLGLAVTQRGPAWTGLGHLLPCLAIAGAPLTGGALAKLLFKDYAQLLPNVWADRLPPLLTLSSVATALLLARFVYLAWPRAPSRPVPVRLWLPWLALLAAGALPWWWAAPRFPEAVARAIDHARHLDGVMPLGVALGLAVAVWVWWRLTRFRVRLPEGDILYLFSQLGARVRARAAPIPGDNELALSPGGLAASKILLRYGERRLRGWGLAGGLLVLLVLGLAGALYRG
ncbi:MAG: complex I subunit 5 family protein [Pseudomonadota bacterium]|nr:complex I subunit 5 family protein [Pseudomonadota bacterium]